MTSTLFWLQSGGCGGDTLSLLNAQDPDILQLCESADIEILHHPSLSSHPPAVYRELVEAIKAGEQALDFFCLEGAVTLGPQGTGMFDTCDILEGKAKKEIIAMLAGKARYVLAVGTCAAFGGITAACGVEATGLQFHARQRGGFLGEGYVSAGGLPVINLSGCPCHCDIISGSLATLSMTGTIALNAYQMPEDYFTTLVHQGCTRNEYHEYRIEESDFGKRGCLFFHMGCKGPITHAPCNKLLWNRRSSKPRAGVPCLGCTQPDFPGEDPFFSTSNLAGIPNELPEGVDRAHYLAYKSMAAAAAPQRLKKRKTRI